MKSEFRKVLEEQDKLGINESFEARLRGALTPYWTISHIIESEDLSDPDIINILKEFIETNKKCMLDISELLNNSELDREFINKKITN